MRKVSNSLVILLLVLITFTQTNASNVYIPDMSIYGDNTKSADIQKELSDQIRSVFSVVELKNTVQDTGSFQTVKFGKFQVTADPTAKEDVEWYVLDKNDTTATLITKYVIGKSPYHVQKGETDYYGTTIYKWVENFKKEAFNDKERYFINKLTIPSRNDIVKYFAVGGSMKLALAYNSKSTSQLVDYWLRCDEKVQQADYFSTYSSILKTYLGEEFGVRPMIEIKLSPLG